MNISYRLWFLFISLILCILITGMVPQPLTSPAETQPSIQIQNTQTQIKNTPAPPKDVSPGLHNTPIKRYCGIVMDGYGLKTGVVKPGHTLTHLLNPHGVTNSIIFKAAKTAKTVFDVRRIKAGNSYNLIYDPNNNNQIKYFIYYPNLENYVVFALDNPIQVYTGQKKVEIKTKTICGTITNNLWNSASQSGMTRDLIYALGDIFASTVDFRHFHKGDQFMVTFEERFIQGKCIGIGKIKAARLTCCDQSFQAFAFENNGVMEFYDEMGNSLEKSFLKCPLKYSRISSKFTNKRLHPITHKYIAHPGIDYAAPRGTPVRCVGDGIITFMGYSKTAGNYIKIKHAGFGISEYMHLSKFHARLKKNQKIKKGQTIGYVGSTGYATGPHLDLRFKKNGKYVDYSKMKLPSGKPLEKSNKTVFLKQVAEIKQIWDDETRITMNLPEKEKNIDVQTINIKTN